MRLFHFGPFIATTVAAETSWLNSNQIVKEVKNEIRQEEVAGIFDEMTINELLDLNLYEGDIILDQGQQVKGQDQVQGQNIQRDLTYRWPNGKIFIEIGQDVEPNVVGVLHQASHFQYLTSTDQAVNHSGNKRVGSKNFYSFQNVGFRRKWNFNLFRKWM